jgi:hypothetical protein
MSRYQVKWTDAAGTHYGIYVERKYASNKDTYKGVPAGVAVVEDSILPKLLTVPEKDLVDLPCDFGGEYDKHVDAECEKAIKASDAITSGVAVGSLFFLPVADGKASYVVTRVGKATCDVEWRGYGGLDRYIDRWLGWGRKKMPLADIKHEVEGNRAMDKLFSKTPLAKEMSRA